MTTTDPIHKTPRHLNSNTAVIHLDRLNKNLLSLKTRLSSYICEPKTLTLYQRMQTLQTNLEKLISDNRDLTVKLKRKILIDEEENNLVQKQIDAFRTLELTVLEYIGIAKMHC